MGENTIIVLIVFGSIFGFLVLSQLISLAKKWVERNNASYDEEKFERLAKAFIQHKKDSERRFQNLEAIVTGDESIPTSSSSSNRMTMDKKKHRSIEIETDNSQEDKEEQGNLKNMLNKKRTR